MNTLPALQQQFQDYLLDTQPSDSAPPFASAIAEQWGLAASERLAIYHRAYRSRLRAALCEVYDKTWSYVGDEMFSDLIDSYIAQHPSGHRNLRWYGGELASHASQFYPDYPFIGELARLEWTLGLAFDAEDTRALTRSDVADIAADAWSELVFALHPSVRIETSAWNCVPLWQAMQAGVDAPAPQQLDAPAYWLVWRLSGQPHFRSLTALEAQALQGIADGLSFGALCNAVCGVAADPDATALSLAGFLQHWLAQEVLVRR
jgi:hypothetical protein